jgi:hypothetical protein
VAVAVLRPPVEAREPAMAEPAGSEAT